MKNLFPSLRGVFGSWVYYPALLSPKQIADLIKPSHDIRESKTLDDYLQREITPNVKKIINYLEHSEDRFFNSIIIGVFDDVPDWFSLDLSQVEILDDEERHVIEDSMGILKLSGDEKLFAIDGQHRVEAIKRRYLEDNTYKDQVSVIFVAHSDTKEGKRRTRRLFSDLNKTAQKVSPGELAIIDEQDIENIVARKIYSEYVRLPSNFISLSKTAPIKADEDIFFTNLLTLVKLTKVVSKLHLKQVKPVYSQEDINEVFSSVTEFLDILLDCIPDLEASLGDKILTKKLRLKDKKAFMRPVGLEIFANLYVLCKKKKKIQALKSSLKTLDLGLDEIYFKDIIFVKNRVVTKNKLFALNLISVKIGAQSLEEIPIPDGFNISDYTNL